MIQLFFSFTISMHKYLLTVNDIDMATVYFFLNLAMSFADTMHCICNYLIRLFQFDA